ncbi:TPA: glycosyltransferase family 4 protein [Vibrio cholerae]
MNKTNQKVYIVSSLASSLINFRLDLINKFISYGYTVVCVAPNHDVDVVTKLNKMGVVFLHIPFNRNGISLLSDFSLVASLYAEFKREKPSVVLNYTIKPLIYGSIAARFASVPNIISLVTGLGQAFSSASSISDHLIKFLARKLYALGLKSSTKVFFQNNDDRNKILDLKYIGLDKADITNGSGVNLNTFPYSKVNVKNISFLMVARLLKEKGVLDYIAAAKLIKAQYPDVVFNLVGPIDGCKSIDISFIEENNNSGVICYHGKQDNVLTYLQSCSIFVLPSYYPEGIPRSILEALSVGRGVITTNSVGCKETVVDGENGFLIPPKAPLVLADKMKSIIDDPSLIEKFSKSSFELAKSRFDVVHVNNYIFEKSCIERKNEENI